MPTHFSCVENYHKRNIIVEYIVFDNSSQKSIKLVGENKD